MRANASTPRRLTLFATLLAPLLLAVLVATTACGGGGEEVAPEPAATEPGGEAPAAGPSPDAAPMVDSRGAPVAEAGGSGEAPRQLDVGLPASWQQETPANAMRMLQASIPGEGGPGEFALFYFGPGQGGGTEANLQRWIEQMEVAPGTEPARERFSTDGLVVTWIEVEGTLNPSTLGMGPSEPQPDSRLLGAVIEGSGGPWFFKVTGPSSTIEANREAFLEMLHGASLR